MVIGDVLSKLPAKYILRRNCLMKSKEIGVSVLYSVRLPVGTAILAAIGKML
jgi:hypothetical protein